MNKKYITPGCVVVELESTNGLLEGSQKEENVLLGGDNLEEQFVKEDKHFNAFGEEW